MVTWKQKTVIRILLIIAQWLTEDDTIREQINQLSTNIIVSREKENV